jgi:hypothetical protein
VLKYLPSKTKALSSNPQCCLGLGQKKLLVTKDDSKWLQREPKCHRPQAWQIPTSEGRSEWLVQDPILAVQKKTGQLLEALTPQLYLQGSRFLIPSNFF